MITRYGSSVPETYPMGGHRADPAIFFMADKKTFCGWLKNIMVSFNTSHLSMPYEMDYSSARYLQLDVFSTRKEPFQADRPDRQNKTTQLATNFVLPGLGWNAYAVHHCQNSRSLSEYPGLQEEAYSI